MGSLGFLCPFSFENYPEYLDGVIKGIYLFCKHVLIYDKKNKIYQKSCRFYFSELPNRLFKS